MRPFRQIIYGMFYKPVLKLYLKTAPMVKMNGFRLKVPRSVFHPGLYFSTGFLYRHLNGLGLKGRSFLEIGCGSGALSLLALSKGARVTAVDLNPGAVEVTLKNIRRNLGERVAADVYRSDVFSEVPVRKFDVIVVNPPYYFKDPVNMETLAWHCGANGEYFHKLFSRLHDYAASTSLVLMCLHENCEVEKIGRIAGTYQVELSLEAAEKIKWEKNYIFRLVPGVKRPASPITGSQP
jgi:release factor glutamine methyltransferase